MTAHTLLSITFTWEATKIFFAYNHSFKKRKKRLIFALSFFHIISPYIWYHFLIACIFICSDLQTISSRIWFRTSLGWWRNWEHTHRWRTRMTTTGTRDVIRWGTSSICLPALHTFFGHFHCQTDSTCSLIHSHFPVSKYSSYLSLAQISSRLFEEERWSEHRKVQYDTHSAWRLPIECHQCDEIEATFFLQRIQHHRQYWTPSCPPIHLRLKRRNVVRPQSRWSWIASLLHDRHSRAWRMRRGICRFISRMDTCVWEKEWMRACIYACMNERDWEGKCVII